jgi:hypothetical protein
VRYAQSRGIGLKVSDEFVVPLCAIHHRQLHQTTKEREWWQERKIDPLMIAGILWRESQRRSPVPEQKSAQSKTDLAQGASEPGGTARALKIIRKLSWPSGSGAGSRRLHSDSAVRLFLRLIKQREQPSGTSAMVWKRLWLL